MSNYDREQREMDAVQNELRLGLILEVAGWTLLSFLGIIVCFIWTGLRAGSYFWLYWTIIEGAIGMVLLGAGRYYKDKAGSEISRLGTEIPRLGAEDKAA